MLNVLKIPTRVVKMTMHGLIASCNFITIFFSLFADIRYGRLKIFVLSKALVTGTPILLTITSLFDVNLAAEFVLYVSWMVFYYFFFAGMRATTCQVYEDQFIRPQQEPDIEAFLFKQYMLNKCCGFVIYIVAPILRNDRKCYGRLTCYTIPFGVMTSFYFVSALLCIVEIKQYTDVGPEGNSFSPFIKCLWVSGSCFLGVPKLTVSAHPG